MGIIVNLLCSLLCLCIGVRLSCKLMGFDEYHNCHAERLQSNDATQNACPGVYQPNGDEFEQLEKKCLSCPYYCTFPKGD
jgi:hypothetical protein